MIGHPENPFMDMVVGRYELDAGLYNRSSSALEAGTRIADAVVLQIHLSLRNRLGIQETMADFEGSCLNEVDEHPGKYLAKSYEMGIRVAPFDRMQQFDIRTDIIPAHGYHKGIITINAYLWDDPRRVKCLADLVAVNSHRIIAAKEGVVSVPRENNPPDRIKQARLYTENNTWYVRGFRFPSVSARAVQMEDIDIVAVCERFEAENSEAI